VFSVRRVESSRVSAATRLSERVSGCCQQPRHRAASESSRRSAAAVVDVRRIKATNHQLAEQLTTWPPTATCWYPACDLQCDVWVKLQQTNPQLKNRPRLGIEVPPTAFRIGTLTLTLTTSFTSDLDLQSNESYTHTHAKGPCQRSLGLKV